MALFRCGGGVPSELTLIDSANHVGSWTVNNLTIGQTYYAVISFNPTAIDVLAPTGCTSETLVEIDNASSNPSSQASILKLVATATSITFSCNNPSADKAGFAIFA